MKIQIKETGPQVVSATYIADVDKVIKIRDEVIEQVASATSKMVIPGFRKGKAPRQAIVVRFSEQINQQIEQKLIVEAEADILFETKLARVSSKVLRSLLDGNHFETEIMFFKRPPVELKQYKGLKIPKPHMPKTLFELTEAMLQQIRIEHGEILPFAEDDTAQTGDKITLDVKCIVNNETIPELTKEGFLYQVGTNYHTGFDDNIVGMKCSETKIFDVLYQIQAIDAETKQQTQNQAQFTVTLHMGVKTIPATLDDEFAQKMGLKDFDALRNDIQNAATNQLNNAERNAVKQQIAAQLLTQHTIEIPDWLNESNLQQTVQQRQINFDQLSVDSKLALAQQSANQIRVSLILNAIREAEPELQYSVDDIVSMLKNNLVAQQQQTGVKTPQDADKVIVELQQQGRLSGLIDAMHQEIVFDFITRNAEIVE